MKKFGARARILFRGMMRAAVRFLPRKTEQAVYRNMVRCDPNPSPRLVLKLAETREELEACFRLLHDAYVDSDLMKPHPSGLRVTVYHALPTTSTLLASYDGRVVGTLSLIRDSALGFPMQRIFDIEAVRRVGGNIAEVSALAIDRRFRAVGGTILFPLMKFMYEYATRYFDTRHLVIAVNPRHIGMYESLLFFRRLRPKPVEHYDFVNGAPAVGAHLDLRVARAMFQRHYSGKPPEKDLFSYFTGVRLRNIRFPHKRFFTTNDPVMTPELIDYFFNERTDAFASLDERTRARLHQVYDLPAYRDSLPPPPSADGVEARTSVRRHRRFSVVCPAKLLVDLGSKRVFQPCKVVECSEDGFRARFQSPLPDGCGGQMFVDLGLFDRACLKVRLVRRSMGDKRTAVFRIEEGDEAWKKFVTALHHAGVHGELEDATRFMSV